MSKMILNGRQYLNESNFYDCKGVFIDTDTVIESGTYNASSPLSYTATSDCYISITSIDYGRQRTLIYVDGVLMGNLYATGTVVQTVGLLLKKGQVCTATTECSQEDSGYTVYGIQQGSAVSIQPVIYSDEEREIGVWRDGKPLYQKTINIAPLPNNTTTEFALDVNTERIISMQGYGYANGDSNKWNIFINDVVPGNVRASIRVYASMTDKKLYVISGENVSVYTEAYVTIYYTKTTDTAGSGTYTQSGVPAVHYSTTEHVIGTWIDGKPLYEKTIYISSLPNATRTAYPHNVSNIAYIVDLKGSWHGDSNWGAIPNVNAIGTDYSIMAFCNTSEITIATKVNLTTYEGYVTIQYTKTTD